VRANPVNLFAAMVCAVCAAYNLQTGNTFGVGVCGIIAVFQLVTAMEVKRG
jgi:hypothetical protein